MVELNRGFAIYSVEPMYSSFVVVYKGPTGTQGEKGERDRGQQRGRVENALTASGRARTSQRWALPCRGIIGTPCIIACVPYTRCAVCDWIGGDGSREIADPNQGGRPTAGVYLGGPSSPSAAALPIYVTVDAWRGRSCVRTQGFSFNYRPPPPPSAFPPPRRAQCEICLRSKRTKILSTWIAKNIILHFSSIF